MIELSNLKTPAWQRIVQEQGLVPVAPQLSMQEQVWLLLPEELQAPAAGKATLRVIQRRAFRAVARGDWALLEALEMVGAGQEAEEEAVA